MLEREGKKPWLEMNRFLGIETGCKASHPFLPIEKELMCNKKVLFINWQDEDQEEESELLYASGKHQRMLNLHHYVGHSLIKHQPQTTTPPPTFRPLSRWQS